MWSGERLTNVQATAGPDDLRPVEKPKLDNARTLRGFYYNQDTLVSLKPTTLRERTLAKPEARDQEDLIAEKGSFR